MGSVNFLQTSRTDKLSNYCNNNVNILSSLIFLFTVIMMRIKTIRVFQLAFCPKTSLNVNRVFPNWAFFGYAVPGFPSQLITNILICYISKSRNSGQCSIDFYGWWVLSKIPTISLFQLFLRFWRWNWILFISMSHWATIQLFSFHEATLSAGIW